VIAWLMTAPLGGLSLAWSFFFLLRGVLFKEVGEADILETAKFIGVSFWFLGFAAVLLFLGANLS